MRAICSHGLQDDHPDISRPREEPGGLHSPRPASPVRSGGPGSLPPHDNISGPPAGLRSGGFWFFSPRRKEQRCMNAQLQWKAKHWEKQQNHSFRLRLAANPPPSGREAFGTAKHHPTKKSPPPHESHHAAGALSHSPIYLLNTASTFCSNSRICRCCGHFFSQKPQFLQSAWSLPPFFTYSLNICWAWPVRPYTLW